MLTQEEKDKRKDLKMADIEQRREVLTEVACERIEDVLRDERIKRPTTIRKFKNRSELIVWIVRALGANFSDKQLAFMYFGEVLDQLVAKYAPILVEAENVKKR